MSKKTFGHDRDPKTGKVIVVDLTVTKDQKRSEKNLIGWTAGPGKSPLKRAARSLWG